MVRKSFGTDGIRGRANDVITPEIALKVGKAAGSSSSTATIAIGWSSARICGSPAI